MNYNHLRTTKNKNHVSLHDGNESIVKTGCSPEDGKAIYMLEDKLKSGITWQIEAMIWNN